MRLRHLKPLRIGLALVFFILIALVFLDFRNLVAPSLARGLLCLQFIPSLLQYVHTGAVGAAGWIVVVVLTVLFGRIYCSTLCPLGTLQDVIGFLWHRRGRRPGFRFVKPHDGFRYAILALTVLTVICGLGLVLNLLDPFSGFGRIAANLLRPLLLFANNLAAAILEQWGVYALPRVQWAAFAPAAVVLSLATLLPVAWLAAAHGRLYCNTVCPVGALLGLLARISWLRLAINRENCKGCTACETVCKAGCIDVRRKTVDASRCVSCCNCLAVCRDNCLGLHNHWRWRSPAGGPDRGRREFLVGSAVFFLGLSGPPEPATRVIAQSRPTTIPERITCPASPPGSGSIARFTARCTACHLCVSACPSRVLVPALFEFGTAGLMQPRLNFHTGHCNYECTICMDVCPSGALLPLGAARKKRTQLGVARFIKENCVVFTDNTACGACSEHCPTKAVEMVPYANPAKQDLKIPEMRPDLCIGCGGCQHACPTRPYRAIVVDGNPEHKLAKPPAARKIDGNIDTGEDFPF